MPSGDTMRRLLRSITALPLPAALCLATLCLALCGCALSPLARRTSTFATAAVAATSHSELAYQLVEQTYRDAQIARLVANYDDAGFDTAKLQLFLSPPDLKIRIDLLDGLRSYAELLAAVSGDQPLTDVDASAKSLGASLQSLSANDLVKARFTSSDANLATAAIGALGRALIEHTRRRELPGILRQMQQPVETICTLLQQDIGAPAQSGLRNELHISYLDLLREQKNYIADNEGKLTPSERREEIRLLPRLATSELNADRALAATQKALAQLARTHTALAATAGQKDAPAFHLQMAQLAASAQQLQSFYTPLPSRP